MAFEELQVPGEPGVWFCARHKGVQTRLRCGRCEKPICPRCTVMGPTGARCHDCASNRGSHIYQVTPAQMAVAFGASLVLGVVGSAVTEALASTMIWLWALFYVPAIGPVFGRLITRITGGKRGPKVASVVSAGIIFGSLLCAVIATWFSLSHMGMGHRHAMSNVPGVLDTPGTLPLSLLLLIAFANLPLWAFIVLALVGVWIWLK